MQKISLAILAGVVIFGLSLVSVASLVSNRFYQIKSGPNTISVTGSKQQVIESDVAVWTASFNVTVGPDSLKQGTEKIAADTTKVMAFLRTQGISETAVKLDSLTIYPNYQNKTDSRGYSTQDFTGYTITQNFTVQSNDTATVAKAATNSGSLIADGILFQTSNPQYYYSKLADLKLQMISDATQNARARAQKIAENSASKLGKLRSASMGIIQITPENSSDVSESGYYDTSSIRKQVTIIVHASFFVE